MTLLRIMVAAGLAFAVSSGLPGGAQSEDVIHAAASPVEALGDVYYAQDNGFFKRNGLNVDLQVINTGAAMLAAIVGGSLQVAGSSVLPLAQARLRGVKVVYLAPGQLFDRANSPDAMIVVRPDSPIRAAGDLNGKTIASLSVASIGRVALSVWLGNHGADADSVKIVESPESAMADAVAAGRVDAALIDQPAMGVALDSGRVRALANPYEAFGRHAMITGWFAMEDWAAKHPSQVKRLRIAIDQAARWAVANPEPAGQVLSKYFRYSVPSAHEYHARSLDPALLQPILDGAARYKVLSAPLDARELLWRS